jgi:hypothetical protein
MKSLNKDYNRLKIRAAKPAHSVDGDAVTIERTCL